MGNRTNAGLGGKDIAWTFIRGDLEAHGMPACTPPDRGDEWVRPAGSADTVGTHFHIRLLQRDTKCMPDQK